MNAHNHLFHQLHTREDRIEYCEFLKVSLTHKERLVTLTEEEAMGLANCDHGFL
jgi:hypothetical protein